MPSPTLPISSCLTSGNRNIRIDLDLISNSPRSSHSSPSSTLSESSNSTPLSISTKRHRAPRKRPNQCSAEASALLSSLYPNLFPTSNFRRSNFRLQQPPVDPFPLLLPSNDATLALRTLPSPPKSTVRAIPTTSTDFDFRDPMSPDLNAESILDEGVEEGIDSIMGNLSMVKESTSNSNSNTIINPCFASLMGFGFGFGISSNIRGALRRSNDAECWESPTVMNVIQTRSVVVGNAGIGNKKKKKKKKRVEKEEGDERRVCAVVSRPERVVLKARLGLKLDYEGVISEWCGGSPFSGEMPESADDVIVSIE